MNRNNFANTLRILVLSLILSTAVGYSLAAWVPPSGAPPNGNPPPPINVGGVAQVRDGNLYLNQWIIAAWAQFGKVGIGTTPTATSPALTINGKAQSSPTVAEDPANTLTTKGYVAARKPGPSTIIKGYPCYGGGVVGDASNNVIVCDNPPASEPSILRKIGLVGQGGTPDARIQAWNNWVIKTKNLIPSFAIWENNYPGKCTFLIPADPTTGKFNLVSEPTGGSAERVLRLQFCSKWIGRASVVDYYRLNPPAPGGIGGTVSQLGSCFQQNSCNGDDVEDEGGRWNITTIF